MDNTQNGSNSVATGISNNPPATDEYSTPIPQGATNAPPQQDEYSTPIPQGATTSASTQPQETSGMAELHALGNVAKGAYKGFFNTVDQTKALADKFLPNDLNQSAPEGIVNAVRPTNTTPENQGEQLGSNVETIGEFLLGDEAIKGLSIADKFKVAAKAMGVLQQFPKMERALQLGINIGKAGAELGPEERALIAKYPVLARLVGVGMDSLRQGGIQTAQTAIHTGGDVKQSLESGAGMASGSALLGGALGTAGGLLEKGGEAANNAEALRATAETAPTDVEANNALQSTVQNQVQPAIDAAQQAIDAAQQAKDAAQEKLEGAASAVQGVIPTAPTKEAITSNAQAYAKSADKALGDKYSKESEAIRNDPDMQGETIPGTGSAFQEKAANAAFGLKSGDDITKALGAGVPASPEVMNLATNLGKPGGLLDVGEDKNPRQLDINNLLDYAKFAKEKIRQIGYSTPQDMRDRQVYYDLLDGIHQSLEDLVTQSGKPELMDKVIKMNNDYRTGINTFKNPDVQALLRGSNENKIINTIHGGASSADINAIRQAIGPKAFSSLADDAMSRIAADSTNPATGEFDMKKWITSMSRIPDDVRANMLNDTKKGGALENILQQVRDVNGSGTIANSDKVIKDSEETIKSILGPQTNLVGMLKKPDQVAELSKLIGPEAMGALGDQILKSQLRAAATDETGKVGSVNTGKVLDFIASLKDSPETVKAFFQPTPERAAAYDDLISKMQNVQGVKNLVKAGVIVPTVAGAGLAAGAIGHSVFAGILGSVIAGGGEAAGKDFIEKVANSPRTWATLRNLSGYKAPVALTNLARVAAGKATSNAVTNPNPLRNIYQSTQTQLGNQ